MIESEYRDQFPIVSVKGDGTEVDCSLEEFEADLAIQVNLWRHIRDPIYGIEAISSCLLVHRSIPKDLQDWLFKALQQSNISNGAVTIDEALGISRKEHQKLNAYNSRKAKTQRSNCTHIMALIEHVTGNKNQRIRAGLVVARDQPSIDVETLVRYYREDRSTIEIDLNMYQDVKAKIEFLSSFICDSLSPKESQFIKDSIGKICTD